MSHDGRRVHRRVVRRLLIAVAVLWTLVASGALGTSRAAAHAVLLSTSPGAGEVLDVAPTEIILRFSETVELAGGAVRVLDVFGRDIDIGRPTHAMGDDRTVAVAVPRLANGGYAVGWKVVSADGHPIDGSFTFSVGNSAQPGIETVLRAGEIAEGAGWAGTALTVARGAVYAGIALLVGSWAFVGLFWWERRRDASFTRSLVAGGALIALGSITRIWLQSKYVDASFRDVVETSTGRAWALTVIAGGVITVAALPARNATRRAPQLAMTVVGAAVLGGLAAYGGHGSVGRWSDIAVVLTIVHVAAMSVWAGGVLMLLLALRGRDVTGADDAASRFSRGATVSVVALVVTGVVQGLRQVDDIGDIGRSSFGRVLLVKLLVIAMLVVAATASRRLVQLRAARGDAGSAGLRSRLRRSLALEVVLALGVIGVTGRLAGASPLEDRAGAVDVALVSADQIAYVTVTPALAGLNQIHVSLASASGAPLAPDQIEIELAPANGRIPPIDVPVELIPPAHATAETTTIPFSGRWTLEITARYGEFRLVTFRTEFRVD